MIIILLLIIIIILIDKEEKNKPVYKIGIGTKPTTPRPKIKPRPMKIK